jgi:hypothetical protein
MILSRRERENPSLYFVLIAGLDDKKRVRWDWLEIST